MKKLPIGLSDFKSIIQNGFYYIDKTNFISEVLNNGASVILLPRPRRFGKTLNLSMLRYFFDINENNQELFQNLNISKNSEAMACLGKYPVIYITFKDIKENNFEIIYCIGENLETRNKGQNNLFEFLKSQFNGIDLNYQKLIIAYEPIWAIGTGITPNIEQIDEILSWLHNFTKKPVIYGGSVKPTNAKNILQLKSCNGVLVGSASLDLNNFLKIIKIAN